MNRSRREFLAQCCQGVSAAALAPAGLHGLVFPILFDSQHRPLPAGDVDFHLHPRYRSQTPLDVALLKTQTGLDAFVTEKYHEQIAAILAEWSSSLMQSPLDIRPVAKALTLDFSGPSFRPMESRLIRPGPTLEIRQNTFASRNTLGRDAFLQGLQSTLSSFLNIITAEFQVVSIDLSAGTAEGRNAVTAGIQMRTRVRYELVGAGQEFYREQRVGHWDLEWKTDLSDHFRLKSWRMIEETMSRTAAPIFGDITAAGIWQQFSLRIAVASRSRLLADGA